MKVLIVRVLVDRFRRTGQTVHLVEEGEPLPVDQGLQISVYRIVQEALTNVQKHARGAPTTASIRLLCFAAVYTPPPSG